MTHLFDALAAHPLVSGGIVLGVVGWALALVRNLPYQVLAYIKARLITSVEIADRDPAFEWLERWLAAHPAAHGKRAYVARSLGMRSDPGVPSARPSPPTGSAVPGYHYGLLYSPAPGAGLVRYRDHRIWIERRRRWYESAFNGAPHTDTFVLTHLGSLDVIKGLMAEALAESITDEDPGIPVLVGNNGAWGHSGFRPRRRLESVMLDAGVLDDLVADMECFYRDKGWYRDRGIPWQRGYLFAGIPGAGKTSAAIALAGRLGLSIAIVSLSSVEMDDQAIARLMLALPERSLLLIEDVDALFKERETQCKVTFAGFLNSLDGVAAAEGRMLIMTTNHPEKLDPALIRFGRIDRHVEFTHASYDQARRLFLWFYRDAELTARELDGMATAFARAITAQKTSMAAIQEHLVRHRDCPAAAAMVIMPGARAA
jgi:mitochondrial chaperone BCS1